MGKYQLDYNGMKSVEKFHEKHSTVKSDKANRIAQLREQALAKKKASAKK